jgi:tRNA A37 methylthiotransferase MiaB
MSALTCTHACRPEVTTVLDAYLQFIEDVRRTIPDVAIRLDFISGFCGETEEEDRDSLSLMETIEYDQAFTIDV